MPMPGNLEIAIAIASVFFLLVAVVAYFVAAKRRAKIDAALKGSRNAERLSTFNLARSDAMNMLEQKYLAIPERLWTYDGFYLERFAKEAHAARLLRGGTALDCYMGSTMNSDVVFAAALGLFVAFFQFDVATVLMPRYPLISSVLMFCACMGAVYGAADVAEDLKLMSILKDWHGAGAEGATGHIHIDVGEAAAANALTRIKIVTICLSILGGVVFLILSGIADIIYRRPHDPTPSRAGNPASTAS
jgi:hypothetical protein